MYKKHSWIPYGSFGNGDTIEITIKDGSGAKIDSMKCSNNEGFTRILNILREKYGFYAVSQKPKQIEIKVSEPIEKDLNEVKEQI